MSNERSPRDVCSMTIGMRGLTGRPPAYERGGAWGTGSFPTSSERRGLGCPFARQESAPAKSCRRKTGETWFPPRTRAECERCSCRLLAAGGPQLRVGFRLFLVGCPELLARARELGRDPRDGGREHVESLAQPEILPDRLL